jgi:hypothetical protein
MDTADLVMKRALQVLDQAVQSTHARRLRTQALMLLLERFITGAKRPSVQG